MSCMPALAPAVNATLTGGEPSRETRFGRRAHRRAHTRQVPRVGQVTRVSRLGRPPHTDRGFTLVEVVIALGVFALIAAAVSVTIAHAADISVTANSRAQDTLTAVDTAEHMSSLITAGTIAAAGEDILVVDVDELGRCTRYTWILTRNSNSVPQFVTETVRAIPVGAYGRCGDITADAWASQPVGLDRTLIGNLRATSGNDPLWRYYSRGNAPLNPASNTPTTMAEPCAIARVDVTLSSSDTDSTAFPTRVSAPVGSHLWGTGC